MTPQNPHLPRRHVLGAGLGLGAAAVLGHPAVANAAPVPVTLGAVTGPGMPYFGSSLGHYQPGSNTTAWVQYARYSIGRLWLTLPLFVADVDPGASVSDLASFETAKATMRSNPEVAPGTNWAAMVDAFENVDQPLTSTNRFRFNHAVRELQRVGVEVHVQGAFATAVWDANWSNLWAQWQRGYLAAYHLARTFGLRRFAFNNEPDVPRTATDLYPTLADYLRGLRIASDAYRCGVADGSAAAGSPTTAIVHGPVLTRSTMPVNNVQQPYNLDPNPDVNTYYTDPRDNQVGWGEAVLTGVHQDYRGVTVSQPIIDVWDTHSYNINLTTLPDYYTDEASIIKQRMDQWAGRRFPIMYSEINIRNAYNLRCTSYELEQDDRLREVADIATTTTRAGVAGLMWFKMSNTRLPDGIFPGTCPDGSAASRTAENSFHYLHQAEPFDIVASNKSSESLRLAGRVLAQPSDLVQTGWSQIAGHRVQGSYDPVRRTFQVLSTVRDGVTAAFELDIATMGHSGRSAGPGPVFVELVNARWSGGIQAQLTPSGGTVAYSQSGSSVARLSITDDSVSKLPARVAIAAATINSDSATTPAPNLLAVQRTATLSEMALLGFSTAGIDRSRVARAVLRMYGHVPSGADMLTSMVFVAAGQPWDPTTVTWQNAPHLNRTARYVAGAGLVLPAGQLRVSQTLAAAYVDVTDAIRATTGDSLTVILAKQARDASDTQEFDRRATFSPPTSPQTYSRPQLELWTF